MTYQNILRVIVATIIMALFGFNPTLGQNLTTGPDNYGRTALDNGITLLVNFDNSTSLTGGRILIGGGLMSESVENSGISNLMIRMILKGNDTMNAEQVAERLDFLGAQVTGECSRDFTSISFVCLSENLPEVLDILSRCIIAPRFPPEELAKLKEETAGSIKSENDNQTQAASKLFWNTVYGSNGYGLPLFGSAESIARIDIDALRRHYRHSLGGDNMIISFASDIAPSKILALAKAKFGSVTPKASLQAPSTLVFQVKKDGFTKYERNQSFILLGYALGHLKAGDVPKVILAHEVMGANVGSRLWDLRQKEQLAYSVYTQYSLNKYATIFRAAIGTDTSKVKIAVTSLQREMKNLLDSGVTASELADARINARNNLIYLIDQKGRRAANMAFFEYIGYGYKFPVELLDAVNRVTLDEINGFIKANLIPDLQYLAIVGKR